MLSRFLWTQIERAYSVKDAGPPKEVGIFFKRLGNEFVARKGSQSLENLWRKVFEVFEESSTNRGKSRCYR